MKPLLQLSDIRKSFGAVRALKGVSFELLPGEVHALLGENGAGKSTLIKVITGAHSPDEGTLVVGDETLRALTPSHARELGIACIYQQPALFPDLTVAENLRFHSALWGHEQNFETILEELKLNHVAHIRARYLSAGQRRRTALAMLKLQGAKLWLLDEPTTNLDSEGRALLVEWTRRHVAAGGLAVIATHQPDEFAARDALVIDLS